MMETLLSLGAGALAALWIRKTIGYILRIQGKSMNPTLKDGQMVWLNRIGKKYRRGDIVVFKSPLNKILIKRIIGLPDETVSLQEGQFFIDGKELKENYTQGDGKERNGLWKMSEGEFFLVGDNRLPAGSTDSRRFGPISEKQILGTVRIRKQENQKIPLK